MSLLINVIQNLNEHKVYTDDDKCPIKDKNKDILNKGIINKLDGVIDTVFNNMKKRGSYTDFRIDYPWLTI
jgi:hypothetical protein